MCRGIEDFFSQFLRHLILMHPCSKENENCNEHDLNAAREFHKTMLHQKVKPLIQRKKNLNIISRKYLPLLVEGL
jgi:hypothetical protein